MLFKMYFKETENKDANIFLLRNICLTLTFYEDFRTTLHHLVDRWVNMKN